MEIEDEESLSVDHLSGDTLVLNSSIELQAQLNKKENRLELCVSSNRPFYAVTAVKDMTEDGGFIVDILGIRSGSVQRDATLIKRSLLPKKSFGR